MKEIIKEFFSSYSSFIKDKKDTNLTPLEFCISYYHKSDKELILKYLLEEYGEDPNKASSSSLETPLDRALSIRELSIKESQNAVSLLSTHGAFFYGYKDSKLALIVNFFHALSESNLDKIKRLFKQGLHPHQRDDNGLSLFEISVKLENLSKEDRLAVLLLSIGFGANINLVDFEKNKIIDSLDPLLKVFLLNHFSKEKNSTELNKEERELVKIILEKNPWLIVYMPNIVKENKKLVLSVIKKDGLLIKHLKKLKGDETIIKAAVNQNINALLFIKKEEVKKFETLFENLVKAHSTKITLDHKAVINFIIKTYREALKCLSSELKKNEGFIKYLLDYDISLFKYIDIDLQKQLIQQKEFLVLKYASDKLKNDESFLRQLIEKNSPLNIQELCCLFSIEKAVPFIPEDVFKLETLNEVLELANDKNESITISAVFRIINILPEMIQYVPTDDKYYKQLLVNAINIKQTAIAYVPLNKIKEVGFCESLLKEEFNKIPPTVMKYLLENNNDFLKKVLNNKTILVLFAKNINETTDLMKFLLNEENIIRISGKAIKALLEVNPNLSELIKGKSKNCLEGAANIDKPLQDYTFKPNF